MHKLNITIEDFKIYKIIKEFNEKFELNIKVIDIEELNLSHKRIGKITNIKILEGIKLKNLKILILCWNYITNIKVLETFELNRLELLNLNYN